MRTKDLVVLLTVAVFVLLLTLPYLLEPFEVPLNTFFKVSNSDLAGGNYTCIVFVSWYGCPYGAADSWVLYAFLSHYGKVSFNVSYSDPDDVYPDTPGLIFLNFAPESHVHFRYLYLYNRYLNATANGTAVSDFVGYGLEAIKSEFPQFYPYVKEYVTEKWASGSFFQPAAYMGSPPHIPSFIIISSGKGTYMLIGYVVSPSYFSGYNATYLLKNYSNLTFIQEGVDVLEEYVG